MTDSELLQQLQGLSALLKEMESGIHSGFSNAQQLHDLEQRLTQIKTCDFSLLSDTMTEQATAILTQIRSLESAAKRAQAITAEILDQFRPEQDDAAEYDYSQQLPKHRGI